eukprot:4322835-Pyramimonas_sp.AAC.1
MGRMAYQENSRLAAMPQPFYPLVLRPRTPPPGRTAPTPPSERVVSRACASCCRYSIQKPVLDGHRLLNDAAEVGRQPRISKL